MDTMGTGAIKSITGAMIIAEGMEGLILQEIVRIGPCRLIGEVVCLDGETARIQVLFFLW